MLKEEKAEDPPLAPTALFGRGDSDEAADEDGEKAGWWCGDSGEGRNGLPGVVGTCAPR